MSYGKKVIKEKVNIKATINFSRGVRHYARNKTAIVDVIVDGEHFRDHCWVTVDKPLASFMKYHGEKKSVRIEATAQLIDYAVACNDTKLGLQRLRFISCLD